MRDLKKEYSNIYITSDYHFGHDNILRISNRPFKTIIEHDSRIIENSNSLVGPNDLLINLGDICYKTSPQNVSSKIEQIVCRKMMVFIGNHDKAFCQAVKYGMLKKMLDSGKLEIVGGMAAIEDSSIAISKMVEIEGQRVFLSHYSYRTWPSAFRDTWHLFGHSHNNLSPFYRSFDVGVDTNNYFPYSWNDIKTRMNNIPMEFSEV